MPIPDVLILGSGPAGVSAAFPLVEAGLLVVMADADHRPLPSPPATDIGEFRRREKDSTVSAPRINTSLSPKLAMPITRALLAHDARFPPTRENGFTAFRSFSSGGFSHIWGALVTTYDDVDLRRFPIRLASLAASYRKVMERIVVSGGDDFLSGIAAGAQHPTWLEPFAKTILATVSAERAFRLGIAANAVATEPRMGRESCNSCGMCLHGCARGAIYNSTRDLAQLRGHANFTYLRDQPAIRLIHIGGAIQRVETSGPNFLEARALVLATGTLNTTALVLESKKAFGRKLRLLSNPLAGMAFIDPRRLTGTLPERGFALAQLCYRLDFEEDYAWGALYGGDTLPLVSIADRLPLPRAIATRLAATLLPAMVVATCYLPGRFSANAVSLERTTQGAVLAVEGTLHPETRKLLRRSMRRLAGHLRPCGLWPLPGSFSIVPPGGDAHVAGTLPMIEEISDFTCTSEGELRPWKNVYVVDGACFSDLPAKHPTLSIMANADRIGKSIVRRLFNPSNG